MARNREHQREIEAALERAGLYDLLERERRSHRPGRRQKPGISYRALALMWKRHRLRCAAETRPDGEPWIDQQIADKFLRTHGQRIKKLGLTRQTYGSLRKAVAYGEKLSSRIKSRRQSSRQFFGHAFGRQKSSLRVIRLGLARQKQMVDPAIASYLRAAEAAALSGKKPIGLF
jgi:hypothetical protein